MAIDIKRRITLKTVALASSALSLPGIATAAFKPTQPQELSANTRINGTGLVISFTGKPLSDGSQRVIITNTSDTDISLSHVYPGIVSTPDGQYDLNSLLVDGALTFAPHEATTLSLMPVNHQAINEMSKPLSSANTVLSVRTTHPMTNGGEPVVTTRSLFA